MKVHLGSGNRYKDEWINVDLYADLADKREDLRDVVFPEESVSRILCIHAIEHIDRRDGLELIGRCYHWLKKGGRIEIETPDRLKCENLISQGKVLKGMKGLYGGRTNDKDGWHRWLSSVQTGPIPDKWNVIGENHLYVWTAGELVKEMASIGFICLVERPKHHGGRDDRDFRIVGTK